MSKFNYNLSRINQIEGIPTVGQVLVFQRQLAKIQTSYHCKCPNLGNHGWLWIICTDAGWILKHGTTDIAVPTVHTEPYTGQTHATKFKYKKELGLYSEYKEHMWNSVRALTSCFTEGLLIDLQTDGEIFGYTAIKIYDYIKDNFLLPNNISWEITKIRTDLGVVYDPDKIVQVYYKKMKSSKLTLAALGDPVIDVEMMRCAFKTFEV